MTDTIDRNEPPRPDLSDRALALGGFIGKTRGEFEPFGDGYQLLGDWLRMEVLCEDLTRIGHSGVDMVVLLLGEDFPLAASVRELWGAAGSLSWLFGDEDVEKSMSITLGDWYITWTRDGDDVRKRMVLIDSNRPIPGGMRRWFERAGIYQPKDFGMHRRWRAHNHIFGASRKPRFASGTTDGKRHFRVLPHLDRMDICDGCFDRWANSRAASVPMPRTQAEFDAAINRLLELSAPRLHRTQEAA